jgi:hypothetical protein
MTDLVRAVSIADIPDGQGRLWRHGDKRIALFRTAAGVYAADNRCPHPGYALKVLTAVRKRDPDQAVALVKGYDGPAAPLETALTHAAAEDNSTASIMVAHAVKTTTAAIAESRAGTAGRAPLAAAARFLAAPKRERFVYQATLDAIDFIQGRAKGDTEG